MKPSGELENEINLLESKLRQSPDKVSPAELKRLYELTGLFMETQHGISLMHNPCSLEGISETVVKMADKLKPCKLLNVGLGGYPLVDIQLVKKGFDVTGVEYAHSLGSIAKRAAGNIHIDLNVVVADGQRLPFKDASFESCLCSETLEHIPDDRKVISEIHRILKPVGYFIMTVPNYLAILGAKNRIAHYLKTKSWISHPNHLREYSYFSAKKLIRDHFIIKEMFSVPFTVESFSKMPYERAMSAIVGLPGLASFSTSIAFLLKKKEL